MLQVMGKFMNISLISNKRNVDAKFHCMLIDQHDSHNQETVVMASYVGYPEAVKAIGAGFIENRPITVQNKDYYRTMTEQYQWFNSPIGLGDVAHGIVLNANATIDGLSQLANIEEDTIVKSYVISCDGNIKKDIGTHFCNRFGLPEHWKEEYWTLFLSYIKPLKLLRNPAFDLWKEIKGVRIDISAKQVKQVINDALQQRLLVIPPSNRKGKYIKGMTKKEYFVENAEELAKIFVAKKPRYIQGTPLNPAIGDMERVPFPSQASVVQGLWNAFEDGETFVVANGTMGTGKSIMACAMMNLFYHKALKQGKKGCAILLSAPSITLKKWMEKEIKPTLPHAKVTIINDYKMALKLKKKVDAGYKPHGLEIYIVSLDKAKLGETPYFAGVWKRLKGFRNVYSWHCPYCYRPLLKKSEDGESWVPLEWDDVAYGEPPEIDELHISKKKPNGLPVDFFPTWKKEAKTRYAVCNHDYQSKQTYGLHEIETTCQAKLWRGAVKSRGETRNNPRWNFSIILRRIKNFFSLYICDEIHHARGESGRGDAFGQLARVAPKVMGLTGTLTTGKSSSLFPILWRTKPSQLIEQGFTNKTSSVQWAKRFGKVKQVIKLREIKDGWTVRMKREPQQPVELAGINPQLTVQLLDFTAFIDLPDIGLPLVPLEEHVELINLDTKHKESYDYFHHTLYDECLKRSLHGHKGAWSKFIPATINFADNPSLGGFVQFDGKEKVTITVDPTPKDYFTAKERKLVEIVQRELDEGRGSVIYNHYSGKFNMNERTKYVLEQHGIEAVILDETDPIKRAEKLEQLAEQGKKVIICNMKLVEVGLDMMYWKNIIFNQLCYEINQVRQAGRRHWRIGQDETCKVYYLVNNGTQQMSQFLNLVAQRSHALMVEGIIDKSPLGDYFSDETSTLASDLANCFAKAGLTDIWKTLAQKEIEHLEVVEEGKFKEVIRQRMRELSNETLRLCGLPSLEEREKGKEKAKLTLVSTPKVEVKTQEEFQQLDIFDFIKVVDLSEYKNKQEAPVEGQLCFNF